MCGISKEDQGDSYGADRSLGAYESPRRLGPHCPFCSYDLDKSPEQAIKENCGFICPDPWGKADPHSCGAPHPCCCAPRCNREAAAARAFLGINWSDKYSKLRIPREEMFTILKNNGFYHIKTFSPDGLATIAQVYGQQVSVYVGLPNRQLTDLASSPQRAVSVVRRQLKPFASILRLVIVGNEPLLCIKTEQWAAKGECGSTNSPAKLLPAMRNVKRALIQEGLGWLPVTTALNGGILEMSQNPWTPCIADFRPSVLPILREIWEFLRSQSPPAPFMVNIYSWFAALGGHIPPYLAVGFPGSALPSDGAYSYYFNFDMQLDMQRVALCKNNVTDLDLWVGETGWPSAGTAKATPANAYWYFRNTIKRAQGLIINDPEKDTIRLRGIPLPVFLFEAFDEMFKFEVEHGNIFENSFGIFREDGLPKWERNDGLIDLPSLQQEAQEVKGAAGIGTDRAAEGDPKIGKE
ncbi:lichenase-2-like [Cyclospora cayetanensis]|uniref:Lichenase-2-like n=1 Tax=Cyclospora cayetanensis TaxID=88456 RepID=A0A6P6S3G4_9EIME|nr:lichenase-2-like [Cyclospora cayetanensis]